MKLIPLSKTGKVNKGKYFAQVDDNIFEYLNQWSWSISTSGKKIYASRVETINGIQRKITMHRVVLGIKDMQFDVDHINGDSLCNILSNLRVATRSQNMRNRCSKVGSTSKYIGVCLRKDTGQWRASVVVNGKKINIGSFKNEEEAARARDAAAKIHYDEFASFNFI